MLQTVRPFTTAAARAAGLDKRALAGPAYRQLFRGVHVAATVPDHPALRVEAALLLHPPGAVASHMSAARVIGAPVPGDDLEHVTVERAQDRRRHVGLRCYVACLAADEIRTVRGLRLSAPHRMFAELARSLGLVDLVVVGDWLMKNRHSSPQALRDYCRRKSTPNRAAASRAAAYVRERVESPMETRLRMLLVLAGLPEPEVDLTLRDSGGTVVMRLDLAYRSVRLAVEYDGRQHVELIRQWERDLERRDDLEDGDWKLVVVTSKGIYRDPQSTIDRVWRALDKRGWPRLRPPTEDWRRHFGR